MVSSVDSVIWLVIILTILQQISGIYLDCFYFLLEI
jgi:hypothetical protein